MAVSASMMVKRLFVLQANILFVLFRFMDCSISLYEISILEIPLIIFVYPEILSHAYHPTLKIRKTFYLLFYKETCQKFPFNTPL